MKIFHEIGWRNIILLTFTVSHVACHTALKRTKRIDVKPNSEPPVVDITDQSVAKWAWKLNELMISDNEPRVDLPEYRAVRMKRRADWTAMRLKRAVHGAKKAKKEDVTAADLREIMQLESSIRLKRAVEANRRQVDENVQACVEGFNVYTNKIIRTQDSREMGAKYLNEIDLGSREECLRLCCETEQCDVFVFEERKPGSCYLFNCGPPENFKCKFTHHANYTSGVLGANARTSGSVTFGEQISKHVHDLNYLKEINMETSHLDEKPQPVPAAIVAIPAIPTTTDMMKMPPIKDESFAITKSRVKENPCSRYQFECRSNSECIAIYNACDGIPQCADGSDEAPELGCPANQNYPIRDTSTTRPIKHDDKPKLPYFQTMLHQPNHGQLEDSQSFHASGSISSSGLVSSSRSGMSSESVGSNGLVGSSGLVSPSRLDTPSRSDTSRQSDTSSGSDTASGSNTNDDHHNELIKLKAYNDASYSARPGAIDGTKLASNVNQIQADHSHLDRLNRNRPFGTYGEYKPWITYRQDDIPVLPVVPGAYPDHNIFNHKVNGVKIGTDSMPAHAFDDTDQFINANQYKSGADISWQPDPKSMPFSADYRDSWQTAQIASLLRQQALANQDADKSNHDKPKVDINAIEPETHESNVKPEAVVTETITHVPKLRKTSSDVTRKSSDVTKKSRDDDVLIIDLNDDVNDRPNGAILSLTLGLLIMFAMAIIITCRLKIVRKRVRRNGKSPYAHDADYLVNGMYL